MSIIKRLFGRGGGPPPPTRDVAALVAPLCAPAAQLIESPSETGSYLGGSPALPQGVDWPTNDGKPLDFLACVDLASLARTLPLPWLPSSGRLSFFYDVEHQPWGYDPKDRGGWAMIFTDDEQPSATRLPTTVTLPRYAIAFREIRTYPSWERPEVEALALTDPESDRLGDLSESVYGDWPCHQIGGFPNPVQDDGMELQCQLASNGIYCGDSSGYDSPEAVALRDGSKEWRLLLQLGSDDDLGVMWGDAGTLYFWIRESDARAGRFERCWVILQCS